MIQKRRCSNCKTVYRGDEYDQLDKVPIDPDEDNPMKGVGYERVCECGAGFSTDGWYRRDELETEHNDMVVFTTSLYIPHGPEYDKWYETRVSHYHGTTIIDRDETEADAIETHEDTVQTIRDGEYFLESIASTIHLEQ